MWREGTSTSPAFSAVIEPAQAQAPSAPWVTTQGNSGSRNCSLSSQQEVVREGAGIGLHKWRNLVCVGMMVILPESLWAEDSTMAILHGTPGVLLNGTPA